MVRTRKGLTERHQKILDFLNLRLTQQGYPPSIREIGEATGISSTSVVTYYLKQLTEMGLIERDAKYSRAVRLTNASSTNVLKIPILGPIAAGTPILVPSPGATYIGDELDAVDVARSLLIEDRPLVVHCQHGNRSTVAVSLLEQKGFKRLYALEAGLQAWVQAGYDVAPDGDHA